MTEPRDEIGLTESVRRRLREALLPERDLIDAIRQEELRPVDDEPGSYRCVCTLAVRRALDPETAELRRLDVTLHRTESGAMITDVAGLERGPSDELFD